MAYLIHYDIIYIFFCSANYIMELSHLVLVRAGLTLHNYMSVFLSYYRNVILRSMLMITKSYKLLSITVFTAHVVDASSLVISSES